MAIKSISFENLRGQTRTVKVKAVNLVYGRNGSGKSTLREALTFVFCGCDSVGTRNPTHLISKDKDNMSISVETDKAVISRTLTRKGSSTLRVDRNGAGSTYTQSKFEELVGKPDTFMSALIPGYFFELDQKLKHAVLEDVLPAVDKVTILEELTGLKLSAEEKLKYGFNRRADLVAAGIAQDRRYYEAAVNQKQGRIAQLSELTSLSEPALADKSSELTAIALTQELWAAYERDTKLVNDRKESHERAKAYNAYMEKRKAECEEKLASMVKVPRPEYSPVDISDLQAAIQPMPAKPALLSDVDSEHCPTCGQVVSPKYKNHIKVHNQKALEDWEKVCADVDKSNALLRNEIMRINQENEESKKAYLSAVEENRKVEAASMALHRELSGIAMQVVPDLLPVVPVPEVAYDKTQHLALLKHQDEYKSAWAVYEHKKKEFDTAKAVIDTLNSEIASAMEEVERFKKLEEALKKLPEIETKKQIGVFNTDKLIFDGSSVTFDGTPLKMLSTGERAKVHLYFARKVMSLMKSPHNIIFIDDADVIDEADLTGSKPLPSEQIFKVYVTNQDMEIVYDAVKEGGN
jgi:DNA repair exonuclease SbcCD ATPase subunit